MTAVGKPRAFKVAFPDADLDKLQSRLDDVELPQDEIVPNADWKYGSNLAKLKQLAQDWKNGNPRGSNGQLTGPSKGVAAWWRGIEKKINK